MENGDEAALPDLERFMEVLLVFDLKSANWEISLLILTTSLWILFLEEIKIWFKILKQFSYLESKQYVILELSGFSLISILIKIILKSNNE